MLLPDGGRGYLSKIFNDEWMASYGFLRADGEADRRRRAARASAASMPALVHTHPNETVRDAIEILREYGVSQMPVRQGRAAGDGRRGRRRRSASATCSTRCSPGQAHLADPVEQAHGAAAAAGRLRRAGRRPRGTRCEDADAVMVVEDGKPVGVLTRHDLLGFLAG